MTATYTSTSIATVFKDRCRFILGDTDTANPLLTDEEIAAALTYKSSVETDALVFLAKGLLARYSRSPVKITQDGQTLDFSERVKTWRELVADAERSATSTPTAGIRIRRLSRPANISTTTEYTGPETSRTSIYGATSDDGILEGTTGVEY